ncbi:MAG: LTA synthase family protein, partial [Butyrivibrio sp.]|nr:LTA synthase family protein [Butyrivibrio sp.]
FPSMPHMLTGKEVVMSQPVNDWFTYIWEDEETNSFYDELKKENFKFNIYTFDTSVLCGFNDIKILDGKISNVTNKAQEIDIFYKLLFKTMTKMSSYRMFPELLKPYFYTNMNEYESVVEVKANRINHLNYDFYQGLLENGLKKDKSSNYVIFQHLMGTHEYTTDENGNYKENSTLEETAKGCMVIVEEYLNKLKEVGVYDDATIIITSDHGSRKEPQVIFYLKEPGETHDVSPITNAPISFREFMPTIAKAAGLDNSAYGQTIYDFSQDELRERTIWIREYDNDYPTLPYYTGEKDGNANVYYGHTYTGDIGDLLRIIDEQPSVIEPMVDSFF